MAGEGVVPEGVVRDGADRAEGLSFGGEGDPENAFDRQGEGGGRDWLKAKAGGIGEGQSDPGHGLSDDVQWR